MTKLLISIASFLICCGLVVGSEQISCNSRSPNALYLRKWAQKFTELPEIPKKCRDVPKETDEEREIGSECPKTGGNLLCLNIRLFSVVRNMCKPFLDNEVQIRQAVTELITEVGLYKFERTPMAEISKLLQTKTGLDLTGYIRKDVHDLIMTVYHQYPRP